MEDFSGVTIKKHDVIVHFFHDNWTKLSLGVVLSVNDEGMVIVRGAKIWDTETNKTKIVPKRQVLSTGQVVAVLNRDPSKYDWWESFRANNSD